MGQTSTTTEETAGVEPRPEDRERLERLRAEAASDVRRGTEGAWQWFAELSRPSEQHRLAWLFTQGEAVEPPHGDCEGVVMNLYGSPWLTGLDLAVRLGQALGGIGWTGKSFDTVQRTGHNRLTATSRIPALLTMPTYSFDRIGGELVGFRFHYRLETSPVEPHGTVCAITYDAPEHANPLVLPRTRDEIVEIVPDVFLGRALLRSDDGHRVVGYFGLRAPRHGGA